MWDSNPHKNLLSSFLIPNQVGFQLPSMLVIVVILLLYYLKSKFLVRDTSCGPEGSRTLFFVYLLATVTGWCTNRYAPRPFILSKMYESNVSRMPQTSCATITLHSRYFCGLCENRTRVSS